MSDRIREGRAKLMRLQTELEVIGEAPGCGSCRHLRRDKGWNGESWHQYICGHPLYCKVERNLILGGADLTHQKVSISTARSETEPCGPAGLLHERRRLHRTRKFLARVHWTQVLISVGMVIAGLLLFRRASVVTVPLIVFLYIWLSGGIFKGEK